MCINSPLCIGLYATWSCFKVWLKQNFFYKKDFDCSYNSIYPTLFCWLLQCLLLATIKKLEQQALNTIIHFYICFQTFLSTLTINPPFLSTLTINPQNTLCANFHAKWEIQLFQLTFTQKMYIGLKFQKTNLRIRISILEILFLSFCVRTNF